MKTPIFSESHRRSMYAPEIEIAKLKFRRAIDRSTLGAFLKKIVHRLSIWIG
jgi:hypothetical protein